MPDPDEITIVEFHPPITIDDFQNLPDLPFDIHVQSSGFLAQFDRIVIDELPSGGTAFRCRFLGAEPDSKVSIAVYSRVYHSIIKRFDASYDQDWDMLDFKGTAGLQETLCEFCLAVEESIIVAVADRAA